MGWMPGMAKYQITGHMPSMSEVSFFSRPRYIRESTVMGILTSWAPNTDNFSLVQSYIGQTRHSRIDNTHCVYSAWSYTLRKVAPHNNDSSKTVNQSARTTNLKEVSLHPWKRHSPTLWETMHNNLTILPKKCNLNRQYPRRCNFPIAWYHASLKVQTAQALWV